MVSDTASYLKRRALSAGTSAEQVSYNGSHKYEWNEKYRNALICSDTVDYLVRSDFHLNAADFVG